MTKENKDIVKLENTLPGNSNRSKDDKHIPKVAKGKVIKRKKGIGRKFADVFLGENIENVSEYVIFDVIIPAAKDLISETVKGAIDMALFGGKNTSSRSKRPVSRVSYRDYYDDRPGRRSSRSRVRPVQRSRHSVDDIILETRGEAEEVLGVLADLAQEYGMVSVAELYEAVDVTSYPTDYNYGWYDLRGVTISRVRDGYLLDFPRPEVLE